MTITRWDFSKSRSNYHFDPTINEDDAPHHKLVGRVEGDLIGEFNRQLEKFPSEANGFLNRLKVQANHEKPPFTAEYDRAELEFLKLDPNHTFFYNLSSRDNPVLDKICDSFKFKRVHSSFHIQKPGGMFPYHIDEIPGFKDGQENHWLDTDPKWMARIEVQVFDWQPGHVWAVGNTYWKQWKSGDMVWHDWRNTPHGTCNFGRTDRVTLQITGLCSQETLDILDACNHTVMI